jgi:hypothetical protein
LINLQDVGGPSLGQVPRANSFANADRKVGLGQTLFRVGQTKVGENVAAAFFHLDLLISCLLFLLSFRPSHVFFFGSLETRSD